MKHYLLAAIFAMLCYTVQAGDTLTRAQVFSCHIGDTLDYKSETHSNADYTIAYARYIIIWRYYSSNSDTLFIVRHRVVPYPSNYDTVTITGLTQLHIYNNAEGCAMATPGDVVTDSMYYGYRVNTASYISADCAKKISYAEGLGKIKEEWSSGIQGAPTYTYGTEELIFFGNNGSSQGTPYYELNGEQLLSYTPIPEECATWVRTAQADPIDMPHIDFFQEKIHTGNKIWHAGHTLVEMIYSYDGYGNGITVSDSLMGYFRNDTAHRLAYLYDKDKVPFYTYDFNKTIGDSVIDIGTVPVDGEQRTHWMRNCSSPTFNGYIEGVGGTNGLCPVVTAYYHPYQGASYTVPSCGALTCFSVCGRTLYPHESLADCMLSTGVEEMEALRSISIYPSVNDGRFTIECKHNGVSFALYNMLGECIKQQGLQNGITHMQTEGTADGLYLYTFTNTDGKTLGGKLIIRRE